MRINPSSLLIPSLAVLLACHAAAHAVEAPSALSQLSAVESSGAERSGEVIEASIAHGGGAGGASAVKAGPRVDVSPAALQRATRDAAKTPEKAPKASGPQIGQRLVNAGAGAALGGVVGFFGGMTFLDAPSSGGEPVSMGKTAAGGAIIGAIIGLFVKP